MEKHSTDEDLRSPPLSKQRPSSKIALYAVVTIACLVVTLIIIPSTWLKRIIVGPNLRLRLSKLHNLSSNDSNSSDGDARIALCVAGNARTFYAPLVHEKIIENVVGPLRSYYPTDIFVLMKLADDPRPGSPEASFHLNETLTAISKLSPTVVTFLNSSYDYDTNRLASKDNRTVSAPNYCTKVDPKRTAMMPYTLLRSAQCLSAIEAHEHRTGKEYRWIYRARPDVVLLDTITSPDDFDAGAVYTSTGPWVSVRDFADWWQEKHEPFKKVPSFGDHFLAGRRSEAGIAMRAIEAIDTCELFDVKGPRNSETSLGLWILSHGLKIINQPWSWSLVRAVHGPDCHRMDLVDLPDPVLKKLLVTKCETYRTAFMAEYTNWNHT